MSYLKSIFESWWGSVGWRDRIILIAVISIGAVMWVQYRIIEDNKNKILELQNAISEAAIQHKIDGITDQITALSNQVSANQVEIAKAQRSLDVAVSHIKSPMVTGMKSNAIVQGFQNIH